MSTVLVTGGAGFIGSAFCHYWATKYPANRLIVVDALTYAGNKDNLAGLDIEFHRVTIWHSGAIEALFDKTTPELVVHFAAETHVDRSIIEPHRFLQTNVLGTQVLIDNALRYGCRFHHVSTDEVYGSLLGRYDAPFTEDSPYRPSSPYAASKAASDHLVRAAVRTHELRATVSHGCNTFGPRQHGEKLIPTLVRCKPMPIYGDGLNRREWIYVDDHCAAIDLIIHKGAIGESYNIGGTELSNLEIAKMVGGPIEFVKDRLGHDFRYAMDSSKLVDLGFSWQEDAGECLPRTIDWYRNECRASA